MRFILQNLRKQLHFMDATLKKFDIDVYTTQRKKSGKVFKTIMVKR